MWDYSESMGTMSMDLAGYDVEATDGGIGTIDEASNEAGSAYFVVDTGFWIFGKKRMLPAGVVRLLDGGPGPDGTFVKAVTYPRLRVEPDPGGGWLLEVYLDV